MRYRSKVYSMYSYAFSITDFRSHVIYGPLINWNHKGDIILGDLYHPQESHYLQALRQSNHETSQLLSWCPVYLCPHQTKVEPM